MRRCPRAGTHSYSSPPRGVSPPPSSLLCHSASFTAPPWALTPADISSLQLRPASDLWTSEITPASPPNWRKKLRVCYPSPCLLCLWACVCQESVCACACVCKGLRKWVISSSEKHVCYAEPHRQTSCCCRPLALITVRDTNMHTHIYMHSYVCTVKDADYRSRCCLMSSTSNKLSQVENMEYC